MGKYGPRRAPGAVGLPCFVDRDLDLADQR
jgi:hypothetical protein